MILIFIFIWTMFTYTHTHRHTDRHTNGRAQISLRYIYVCIYLLQQIMADWLSLAVLVGVVAIYYGTLTPCRNTLCSKLNFNIATVRQWSLGNNVCYGGFASCVHLLELRWGINKSTFISCLLPECRQQTVVKPHCPTLLKLKTGLPLSISFFLFSAFSLSLCVVVCGINQ